MELIEVMQGIIQDCVKGMSPTELTYGTVISVSPLTVEIQPSQFMVSEPAVTDSENVRKKEIMINGETVTVTPGLTPGDKVIAVRSDAGQRYVIISKV